MKENQIPVDREKAEVGSRKPPRLPPGEKLPWTHQISFFFFLRGRTQWGNEGQKNERKLLDAQNSEIVESQT